MTTTATQSTTAPHATRPKVRATRLELIADMLGGVTRTSVPIRSSFIQKPASAGKERGNMLASLSRNQLAFDAYLLTHALASASAPYDTKWPIENWVQVTRYDQASPVLDKQRQAWGRGARTLERHRLVKRHHRRHYVHLELLDESGSGAEYTRPRGEPHQGTWFNLPYLYWLDRYDENLSFSAKRMLLVVLDQKDVFRLPVERASLWYGVSKDAAADGLNELFDVGIIERESGWVPSARSKSTWRQVVDYTAVGPWSNESRRSERPPAAPAFEDEEAAPKT